MQIQEANKMCIPGNLLEISNLTKCFTTSKSLFGRNNKVVKAVDGINLNIRKGEIIGIVGESGCGKSTLGRSILRLIEPTTGNVIYNGESILKYNKDTMREMRKKIQIIFQNPYASLNPRMTVLDLVKAPLDVFDIGTKKERVEKVIDTLKYVGLGEQHLRRYPHEFSGGQRQRIVIARALILNPEFIVCDEPVSALDVSVRSQVLNLMMDIQKKFNLTYMFISHDLSVVRYICNRVAVMYLGAIVEVADKEELYENPLHPYTKALLSSIPIPDTDIKSERIILSGDVPSPYNKPSGCRFHTRCAHAKEICKTQEPMLNSYGEGHSVACHLYSKNLKP